MRRVKFGRLEPPLVTPAGGVQERSVITTPPATSRRPMLSALEGIADSCSAWPLVLPVAGLALGHPDPGGLDAALPRLLALRCRNPLDVLAPVAGAEPIERRLSDEPDQMLPGIWAPRTGQGPRPTSRAPDRNSCSASWRRRDRRRAGVHIRVPPHPCRGPPALHAWLRAGRSALSPGRYIGLLCGGGRTVVHRRDRSAWAARASRVATGRS
jgi:hypothetical protein